jgi:hypothetical protein
MGIFAKILNKICPRLSLMQKNFLEENRELLWPHIGLLYHQAGPIYLQVEIALTLRKGVIESL